MVWKGEKELGWACEWFKEGMGWGVVVGVGCKARRGESGLNFTAASGI